MWYLERDTRLLCSLDLTHSPYHNNFIKFAEFYRNTMQRVFLLGNSVFPSQTRSRQIPLCSLKTSNHRIFDRHSSFIGHYKSNATVLNHRNNVYLGRRLLQLREVRICTRTNSYVYMYIWECVYKTINNTLS